MTQFFNEIKSHPMKIHELQEKITETLNDDETLIQGRCKAFAEDSLTVLNDVTQ